MKFNLILGQGTSSFNFGYILQPIIKQISQSYKNREVLLSWLYRQRHKEGGGGGGEGVIADGSL